MKVDFYLKARTIRLCNPISVKRQKPELMPRKWAGKGKRRTSSAALLG